VNLLGDDAGTIKGHTETVIEASKEVDRQVNVEKAMYMLVSHDQQSGQNLSIK
jgi:hypothetical protein